MDFIIPAKILGTKTSLLVKSDGTYETYDPSKKLENKIISVTSKGFWERIKLYKIDVPSFPPERFKKPYKHLLGRDNNIPWKKCIPVGIYQKELKCYIEKIREILCMDFHYYNEYFLQENLLLESLEPANIDLEKFESFLSNKEIPLANKSILKSFTPIRHENGLNLTDRVRYNRISSRTGRLTVAEGPQILNLKTEYRKVLKSRYADGGVFYLDYKSLEPRCLLSKRYTDKKIPKDIYKDALEALSLEDKVDRKTVKTALISVINGAGEKEVANLLNKKVDYPEDFIKAIKEHFGINELREELSDQYSRSNGEKIYNYYERPIFCKNTAPYVLLNYYVQSTAVDIALLGFNKIWAKIMETGADDFIKPLFVLHDALILDVSSEMFHLLPKIANIGTTIPKFKNVHFWIDIERLA